MCTTVKEYNSPEGYCYTILVCDDYAYCCVGNYIVRVNLQTNKVTKYIKTSDDKWSYVGEMAIYNGYLYYNVYSEETGLSLYRASTKTGDVDVLEHNGPDYYGWGYGGRYKISNNKLYLLYDYSWFDEEPDFDTERYYEMNLDGTNRKITYASFETKYKQCNSKGYGLISKEKGIDSRIFKVYFKKSNGKKVYLGKYYCCY